MTLKCQVLEEDNLAELGMNLFLSVTQGSTETAKFIILDHQGSDQAPIVLIGKGVTFDTSGYSIKGRDGMVGLKTDMGGAAAVIGIMRAVSLLKLPQRIVALIPCSENMISGSAIKPNDIFQAMNGTTVEITSTDAEGRLLLADSLCYADRLNPQAVIDLATLTGGVGVALGKHYSGLFCDDPVLSEQLQQAGDICNEKFWPLPNTSLYNAQLKSQVADLKNSEGRLGQRS